MQNINLLQQTKHLIRLYGFSPKKRLGQNFTVNIDVLYKLISYASLSRDDIVLEVGSGFGFLTKLLSEKCKKVIAFEIDPILVEFLRMQFRNIKNVDFIEGDILNIPLPYFNKVVSAPPYSISSILLFRLLETKFDSAVFIFQKEFAERLAASIGTKDYGRLTITIYYKADVELLDQVSRMMFYPHPDVDSMIVRLKPRCPPFQVDNEEVFLELVRDLFTQKNKKIRNALIPFLRKRGIFKKDALEFADSIIHSTKRARDLTPEDLGILSNELLRRLESCY